MYGADTLTDDRAPAEVEMANAIRSIVSGSSRVRTSTISSFLSVAGLSPSVEPSETPGFASPPHGGFALVEESSPELLSADGGDSLSAGE